LGACAWCLARNLDVLQDKTMALLQQEGYKVTAVDLASCGTSTVDPNTVTDFKTYNQPLVDVLNAIPDTEQVITSFIQAEVSAKCDLCMC